ncbi:putative RNA uridine N3 methyltransferase [Metallosphaera tengchongensis]|nr:putative RNA uridine N3 methyltransferase [Metallosphaera tengchongensis]
MSDLIRFFSITRVTKIYLVKDRGLEHITVLFSKLLKYTLKPPYLKKLIPIDEDLKKVGLTQPINIPYHAVSNGLVEGEIRVTENHETGIRGIEAYSPNTSFIMIIDSKKPEFVDYVSIFYEGPQLEIVNSKRIEQMDNLILASRSGYDPQDKAKLLREMYYRTGITVLVGPPEGGILRKFSGIPSFNFLPKQGATDVRSKEALMAGLSILNILLS